MMFKGSNLVAALMASAALIPPPSASADPAPSPTLPATSAAPADLDGDWVGALDVHGVKLGVVFHLKRVNGALTAMFDVPDQGVVALSAQPSEPKRGALEVSVPQVGAKFTGTMSSDGQSLGGVFSQNGATLPLTLQRKAAGTVMSSARRPQEEAIAASPLPYSARDVRFENPVAPGVVLAGTLTEPAGAGPFPAVVLISGSGRNGRDEEAFGHKIFLVLADHLTRQGIAVLRYDKRGAGQSTGDYKAATTADFALDAEAAVAFLRGRPEISPREIGLVGHSEGGVIAPMVAAKDRSIAFVVLMAGTGVPGRVLLPEQDRRISLAMGEPAAEVRRQAAFEARALAGIADAKTDAEAKAAVAKAAAQTTPPPPTEAIKSMTDAATRPWMRFFLLYDPTVALKQVKAPILVLNGEKDLQVPPDIDLPPMRKALADNPNATIILMPGLNHLFQHAATGSPAEYAKIEETLSPELLDTVTDWIKRRVD